MVRPKKSYIIEGENKLLRKTLRRSNLSPQDSAELHEIWEGNRQKLLLLDYDFFILRGLSGICKNQKKI